MKWVKRFLIAVVVLPAFSLHPVEALVLDNANDRCTNGTITASQQAGSASLFIEKLDTGEVQR